MPSTFRFLSLLLNYPKAKPKLGLFLFLSITVGIVDVLFLLILNKLDFTGFASASPSFNLNTRFLLLLSLAFPLKLVLTFLSLKQAQDLTTLLNRDLLSKFLLKPLRFFSPSGPKELSHIFSIESDIFFEGVLYPLFQIIQTFITLFLLLLATFIINIYLFSLVLFSGLIVFIFGSSIVNPFLKVVSIRYSNLRSQFSLLVSHYFDNLDFIRSRDIGGICLANVSKTNSLYKHNWSLGFLVGSAPRFLLESFGYTIVLFFVIFLPDISLQLQNTFHLLITASFVLQRMLATSLLLGVSALSFTGNLSRTKNYILLAKRELFSIPKLHLSFPDITQHDISNTTQAEWRFLSCSNLSLHHHNLILDFGDLTFKSGDIIGFSGPSGCGKSTFLKLLLGTELPTGGKILLDDLEVGSSTLSNLSSVSFQKTYFMFNTVIENLYCCPLANISGDINFEKINDIVDICCLSSVVSQFGLYGDLGESCTFLSGGQQLRLSLARALFPDRQILILDEPTSGLEENLGAQVLSNIYENKRGRTIFIVSHNLSDYSICSSIYSKTSASNPFIRQL